MPLLVVAGAAGGDAGRLIHNAELLGAPASAFIFGAAKAGGGAEL